MVADVEAASSESLATVVLRPGEADRVVAGHPWIYEGAVQRPTQPVEDGAVVQVRDSRQRFLGIGFWNSRSKIRVRMVSSRRVPVDQGFFEARLRSALAVRQRYLPDAGSFRVVNAESDGLSGLTVDKYEDIAVVQISALGMDRRKSQILAALQSVLPLRAVVERSEMAYRKFEGLPEANGFLAGNVTGAVTTRLNGLTFEVDLLSGHKTGLYLDQQVNYRLVADLVARRPGARVLDAFSYLGAFALHAARAGAGQVHGVEQNEPVVAAAARMAAVNGLAERCTFEAANVFDWLKSQTAKTRPETATPRYDVVILDPPSFTRTRASIPDALRGYKEIHLRALRLLPAGGLLATFCCSHHVTEAMFLEAILAAAFDARKSLRRVALFRQSPDHPVLPSVPETEYLKGFAFEVVSFG